MVLTVLGVVAQFFMCKEQDVLPSIPRKNKKKTKNIQTNRTPHSANISQNTHERHLPVLVNSRDDLNSEFDNQLEDEQLPILVHSRSSAIDSRRTRYGTNIVC